jgi:thiamine-phosphate pyrophosphorylase
VDHADPAVLRILDANRNRALEALRVVEEHARFVLEASGPAAQAKSLRHQLQTALAEVDGLAARDVTGDPGRPAVRSDDRGRASAADVARANAGRAKEALRVLEEYTKLLDPAAAHQVSAVRYGVYGLEQALFLGAAGLRERRVYVLLGSAPGRPPVLEQARACLTAGVRLFQLREKSLDDRAWLGLAREVQALCAEHDAWLILNDRPDLARLSGARGVHVGRDDLPAAEARRIVGPGRLVGTSVHDAAELAAAVTEGADHVGVGTLFASPTKPDLPARGLDLLRELAPTCPLPIYGIGGVTAGNAGQVLAAGATGVAVAGAVLDAADVEAAARELVEAVEAVAAQESEATPTDKTV